VPLKTKRSRVVAVVVVASVVLVLAFVALTLLLFVYPDVNAPQPDGATALQWARMRSRACSEGCFTVALTVTLHGRRMRLAWDTRCCT